MRTRDFVFVVSMNIKVHNPMITVVWILFILETLGSQRLSRILEETLDVISFMWLHCDTSDGSRGHRQIGVFWGKVFV